MNTGAAGVRSNHVIVVAGRRGDPRAIRIAVDPIATNGRLQMPAERQLNPIVVARWACPHQDRGAVLRVTEVHAGQINAIQPHIEPAFRLGRIVDAKVHFPQPRLGLVTVPTVEHGKVVEERLSAQMHSHVPQLVCVSNRLSAAISAARATATRSGNEQARRKLHQVSSRNSTAIMPNSSDATIAMARAEIFLQFSDSITWRRGGFWRYRDRAGNQRISRGLRAR